MNRTERSPRGNYIQGHFVKVSDPNGEIESRNPGDIEAPGAVFPFCFEHVHEAVMAAKRSFPTWRRQPINARIGALARYRDLLEQRSPALAVEMAREVGKPVWEARLELGETLELIDYYLKTGSHAVDSWHLDNAGDDTPATVRFHARGVIAVIAPASQPLLTAHAHFIPALFYGNTVVWKIAKATPALGQCVAEIAHEAGIPAGVFNAIQGDGEVARRLVADSDVDGVFFTGNYETGFKIRKQCLSDYWKVLVMQMGGKNSHVVWDDCRYERALYESFVAAYLTSGQRCASMNRLIVHDRVFDRFVDDFHALSKKARIGLGTLDGDEAPFMGPLLNEAMLENYLRYQGIAVREGAEEIMRGKHLDRSPKGYYVSPSIHVVRKPDSKSVYQKNEMFGPNVAVYRVRDIDEAVEVINLVQHGLVASIYTAAKENYLRLADEAKVGLLHWNRPTTTAAFRLPVGGIKKSGNARPMGSLAAQVCTYPVASLEHPGTVDTTTFPAAMPKLGK